MPLRIRIAPDGRSKEMHARRLMEKVAKALDNKPIVDGIDGAMVIGNCDECYTRMWKNLNGIPYYCEPCKEEKDKEKEEHGMMARLLSVVKNDGMAQH